VRILLDTHLFLWAQTEPKRLAKQLPVVEDLRNTLLVSAASSWEVAIKYAIGKLPLPELPARYMPERIRAIGAETLPIEHTHALAVAELPPLHSDPFDRLLIAQAKALDVPIVTADPVIAQYPVRTLLVAEP
jgi:PIN domain nuclease of toxin-antitoxin system